MMFLLLSLVVLLAFPIGTLQRDVGDQKGSRPMDSVKANLVVADGIQAKKPPVDAIKLAALSDEEFEIDSLANEEFEIDNVRHENDQHPEIEQDDDGDEDTPGEIEDRAGVRIDVEVKPTPYTPYPEAEYSGTLLNPVVEAEPGLPWESLWASMPRPTGTAYQTNWD